MLVRLTVSVVFRASRIYWALMRFLPVKTGHYFSTKMKTSSSPLVIHLLLVLIRLPFNWFEFDL